MDIAPTAPTGTPIPELARAAAELGNLVQLTAPGLEVAPVVASLGAVRDAIDGARPQLERRGASQWLLGEVDRVRGAAATLRDALAELAATDGMKVFDPAFAADDAAWDAAFREHVEIVERAEGFVAAPLLDPPSLQPVSPER